MFKYVLVPATGAEKDAAVFAAALTIARRFRGHIKALHIRPDVKALVAAMASADWGGGVGYEEILESFEAEVAARQQRAEATFREFCLREKLNISKDAAGDALSAEWQVETGDEATCMAEHGRTADLIVLGGTSQIGLGASTVLEAVLMQTGRPVFIVPEHMPTQSTGTVVIAWKDREEAARAVTAAHPFVEAAAKVIILSVQEDTDTAEHSSARLQQALLWHNPNTTVQLLKQDSGPASDILLASATAAGADMLVMGGYGHSRMREMIFGGFTRRVLSGADVPVFIVH